MQLEFGEFLLDLARRELRAGTELLHLSTKAFQLLEVLVQNAPRAMTKDELYRHIWGDAFVEEVNLPNLISEVRGALGDSRKSPRYIKTIHGFGYAFAGELRGVKERSRKSGATPRFALRWRQEEFPLRSGENVVGRGDDCDVIIPSGAISRRHARLTVGNGGVTIEDLQSKNGTFVAGEKIESSTPLHDGDEIRLGMVELVFCVVDSAATTVTGIAN